jgi:hypothetical protein
MRRVVLACLVLLAGLTAVPSASAASKTVSGDILGSDLRAVDVFIGIDLNDSAGRPLKADGSISSGGYAITMRINQDLDATGSTDRAAWTTRWAATVPSNTAKMYVEVYPRAKGQYGATDLRRYGRSLRRFGVASSLTNVHLRMPVQCSQGGGTGSISGVTTIGGVRKQANYVSAFSIGADNNAMNPILGWNIGSTASNGTFSISALAPNTKYRVFMKKTSTSAPVAKDVVVGRCANSTLNFAL